jgi:hypothetical protein
MGGCTRSRTDDRRNNAQRAGEEVYRSSRPQCGGSFKCTRWQQATGSKALLNSRQQTAGASPAAGSRQPGARPSPDHTHRDVMPAGQRNVLHVGAAAQHLRHPLQRRLHKRDAAPPRIDRRLEAAAGDGLTPGEPWGQVDAVLQQEVTAGRREVKGQGALDLQCGPGSASESRGHSPSGAHTNPHAMTDGGARLQSAAAPEAILISHRRGSLPGAAPHLEVHHHGQ